MRKAMIARSAAFVLVGCVISLFGCSASHPPTVNSVLQSAPTSALRLTTVTTGLPETPQLLTRWTTKAGMPTGRFWLAAGVVNGSVYAIGGYGTSGFRDT